MSFAPYQAAGRCRSGPQPGTVALMKAVLELPEFSRGFSYGIYNCRPVRGTSDVPSVHGEGRAGDPGFRVGDGQGDALLATLREHAEPLGIQYLIYERRAYSLRNPGGSYYGGVNPHRDHIHFEQSWAGALRLTLPKARAILSGAPNVTVDDHGPVGAFPLPSGHGYGVNDRTAKSHSGKDPRDRLAIRAIQREVGARPDGWFGEADTLPKVRDWQRRYRLEVDGIFGPRSWAKARSV